MKTGSPKTLMIVLDGLGDRPYYELGKKTPLEYANTPNLNKLACKSMCGMMYSLGPGIRPSSDAAHMSLFGLDINKYYTGRGPIELYGIGQSMKDKDLAFRGNFSIIGEKGIILDRRAKRKAPTEELLSRIHFYEIDGIIFELFLIAEHRFVLKLSGEGLGRNISNSDPHIEGVTAKKVKALTMDAKDIYTADIINKYIFRINQILSESNYIGNGILLRSGGVKPSWFDFQEHFGLSAACIANNALYNGIGRLLGMRIVSLKHFENFQLYYDNIFDMVIKSFSDYDFVFLHMQEADLYGEDGDVNGKVLAIEKMDQALQFVNELDDNTIISVTSDHSTPCHLQAHSGDSVPIMIYGRNLRFDDVVEFGECFFSKGSLGVICGKDYMNLLLNSIGRAPLVGG